MNFPTEEEIDIVISELRSHDSNKESSSREDHLDSCPFCQVNKEMEVRNANLKDDVCLLDRLIANTAEMSPFLTQMANAPIIGPEIQMVCTLIGRICFMVGVKATTSKFEGEQLKKILGDIV